MQSGRELPVGGATAFRVYST
ncbi:hypothetical protein CHELA17_65244 [Chelatococcus asaccharovorans]|nr:hypothetical protein CHELA17_65244 [Chelatococcus asaccharovorans]